MRKTGVLTKYGSVDIQGMGCIPIEGGFSDALIGETVEVEVEIGYFKENKYYDERHGKGAYQALSHQKKMQDFSCSIAKLITSFEFDFWKLVLMGQYICY